MVITTPQQKQKQTQKQYHQKYTKNRNASLSSSAASGGSKSTRTRTHTRTRTRNILTVLKVIFACSIIQSILNHMSIVEIFYDEEDSDGESIDWTEIGYSMLPINSKLDDANENDEKEKYSQSGNDNGDNDNDNEGDDHDDHYYGKDNDMERGGADEIVKEDDNSQDEDDTIRKGGDDNQDGDDNDNNKKGDDDKESNTSESEKITDNRMNILLLYPDDWRHDSLGSEKPYVLTPFLNQLANEGIRFTYNAVTTSVCWMSRATMWMGQYTSRHGSYKLKCPEFSKPENWKHSWVSILKHAGYYVGHIGKWQYGFIEKDLSFDHFDHFSGFHWYQEGSKRIHGSDLAKDKAFQFFDKRDKDKPFALSVAFYPPKPVGSSREPGAQWEPTNETRRMYDNTTIPEPETMGLFDKLPKFLQKTRKQPQVRFYERYRSPEHFQASMKNYYALITGVDQACKEIVDRLKEEGLYNNTMIIFTTDNGMFHGAHGLAGKWYPYQESIRVPLIIYDPRMPSDKIGTLDDSFTLNIDIAETILGAAGLKPDNLMQGRDISDIYLPKEENVNDTMSVKKKPWREEFFYEFPYHDEDFIPSSTALVRKDWKYINWSSNGYQQLFNLKDDPLEMNDLNKDFDAKPMFEEMKKQHDILKKELHNDKYLTNTRCYNPDLVEKSDVNATVN
jgi:arylsulfatase